MEKLSSKEILKMLEEKTVEYDDYEECELSSLDELSVEYMRDVDYVFIKATDGVLVIPYEYTYCYETYTTYEILYLESAYMAHDKVQETLNEITERYNKLIAMLEASK